MRSIVFMLAVSGSLAGSCCWNKWGDASTCGNYPDGGSGGICGNDGVTVCQNPSDCDDPTPPTPAPMPSPTPTPSGICCWNKWGDSATCGNYPDGGSGGLCGNDGVTVCQDSSDCDDPTPPTPTPTPSPTPTPTPSPTPTPTPTGDWFKATTTHFTGDRGSCGGCSLGMMESMPGWATVAVAESMQIPYACQACPDCHCATGHAQRAIGGAPGGCGQCYEVRTTGTNPYGEQLPEVAFKATVVDSCPFGANQEWCAQNVGQANRYGFEYHIDVFAPDHAKLGIGNNPIVDFRPIDCPADILDVMQQQCCDVWYPGQGCNAICAQDYCPPGEGGREEECPGGSLAACAAVCEMRNLDSCLETCFKHCPESLQV